MPYAPYSQYGGAPKSSGGTMVPAVAAAAGSAIGGAFQYFGGKGASRTQARSDAAALAFAREQEAARRQEYEQQQAMQREQWEAEQRRSAPFHAAKLGLLREYYGDSIDYAPDDAMGPEVEGGPVSKVPVYDPNKKQRAMGGYTPLQAQGIIPTQRRLTLGNIANWNQWGS